MNQEFFVTLLSNADTSLYENTLTNFTNSLPRDFNFPTEDNWHVCIKSFGFSTKFSNIITPKKTTIPSIIVFERNYNDKPLNDHDVYVPDSLNKFLRPNIKNKDNKTFYDHLNVYHETHLHSNDSIENLKIEFDKINQHRDIINISLMEGINVIIKPLHDNLQVPKILEPHNTAKWRIVDPKNTPDQQLNHSNVAERTKTLPHRLAPLKHSDFLNKFEVQTGFIFLLHESTVKTFGFSKHNLREKFRFDGELYFVYVLQFDSGPIVGELKNWYFKYPELVRVGCDIIEEQIFDSGLDKTLTTICPKFDPFEKYYYHMFDTDEYVKISNTNINKITINLQNKEKNYLNLLPGPATFVKLKFKKMDMGNQFFNVRLSSKESEFVTDLPKSYYLDDKWKVALTSFNYPTDILQLPADEESRSISIVSADGNYVEYHVLPNIYYENIESVLDRINSFISLFSCYVKFIKNLKRVKFTIAKNFVIILPINIAKMLGCEPEHHITIESDRFLVIDNAGINATENDREIYFTSEPDINYFKPEYIMVYCDIIEPCIVSSQYMKLLSIVPLKSKVYDKSTYHIAEFPNPQYHSLESTLVKNIAFSFRSHSGNLISFSKKSRIFMNLSFSRS